MTIFFDSRSSDCKEPFGAVKAGQPIRFCVRCGRNDADVRLYIRNDADTFEQRITLLAAETDENGLTAYRGKVILISEDLYFYRFEIRAEGEVLFCGRNGCLLQTGDWLPEWQLTVYNPAFDVPAWVKGGVMYQIFPDRFAKSSAFMPLSALGERINRGDWGGIPQSAYDTPGYSAKDFFGGNLKGITEHLDRLQELGVTLLYLNPIFEGPENHRYGTGDYLRIDPWLGTEEDFRELCNACESRGIRVILDGVFNHTGADSRYFNRFGHYPEPGAWQSKESLYYGWYHFTKWPDEYECWWNFPNLPDVREENPDYVRFITGKDGVLSHWQESGCKGWRLDVADELPDGFIEKIRASVKAADPDALLLGEVWEDASNKISQGHRRSYLLGKQLDSVMNYPFRRAVLDFVLSGDSALFKEKIMSILENYPQPAIDAAMNMLSTHDTVRVISALGVEHSVEKSRKGGYVLSKQEYEKGKRRLKAAAFLQFTLPGIPSIYYGDEAGLAGFEDPFNRGCYPWGREDSELLDYFKALSAFRKSRRNDFSSGFSLIHEEAGLFVFCRGKTRCAVNFGKSIQQTETDGSALLFLGEGAHAKENMLLLPPGSFAAYELTG